MARYLIGRVLGLIGVLLAISFITFVLMKSIPGGPYDEMHMPLTGPQKANILRSFGLDKPFLEQYLRLL